MPESTEFPEADLDTQLRGLFQEAEQKIQGRLAVAARPEPESAPTVDERVLRSYASLPSMLRPMVLGLEAISRATGENATLLQKMDKAIAESAEAQQTLPQVLLGFEALLEQKNTVSQRMFDAMHEELKGYKDGFLMESVLRPIIRDLISLFDDLSIIHRQMQDCTRLVAEVDQGSLSDRLGNIDMNIEHHCGFVLEILERLGVTLMATRDGKLDKQSQRAVAVEIANKPEDDMVVTRTVKRGFLWKDRVLRPEEVVMRKWKEGLLTPLAPSQK